MFTGLIEATAKVLECSKRGIAVERPVFFDDIRIGSSIAVSGACLTVVELTDTSMRFDVHEETWKRTKFGELKKGDPSKNLRASLVNLERALKAGDRLEGHIVQGHVDGVGEVRSLRASERSERVEKLLESAPAGALLEENARSASREAVMTISYPSFLRGFIVEKGSIAIDGVSLTVASVSDQNFTVALIPQTLEQTILGGLKEGDRVHLEADILGKYAQSGAIKG